MRTSPLDEAHRGLGAKMVPFGGWEMPLSYPAGTVAEHLACRNSAVVFDVSHLGTVRVSGAGSHGALQRSLTNDLDKIAPGRAQYTHLLDDDGSVLDDIIVWWIAPDEFDVMPNASNTAGVATALGREAQNAVMIEDTTDQRALVAIQGPEARECLAKVSQEAASIGRFRVSSFQFAGTQCVVAGTGYTGEDGVECAVPISIASEFWGAVLATGVQPAGLGARDTLRLEAGLPLHGHELGRGITSLNAGLGWVVAWDKGPFPGRDALVRQREAGVSPLLRGLRVSGRRPPRADQLVMLDGGNVGRVTSGNYSPVLGCGIAMAMIDARVEVGAVVSIDVRGSLLEAEVVAMPFVSN